MSDEIQVLGCEPGEHKWLISEGASMGVYDGKPCMCGARVWSWYTVGQFGVSKPNGERKVDDESDERGITKLADNSDSDNMGGADSDDVATHGRTGSADADSDDADGTLRGRRTDRDAEADGDTRPDRHGTGLPWPW